MSHANRGKLLEHAVTAGALMYKREGRAGVRKRDAKQKFIGGRLIWTSQGDVDFSGDADGRAFYAECKETREPALPLSKLTARQHQLDKLADAAARKCTAGVIVGFLPAWRVYWIPYDEIAPFLEAPWRRSISETMCSAWGMLLPVGSSPSGKPLVKFLDGAPHSEKDAALVAVAYERASAVNRQAQGALARFDQPFDMLDPKMLRRLGRKYGR